MPTCDMQMEGVFSIQSTYKQMKWEYVQYDMNYGLITWIEMESERNGVVFREWNERMKRLEGLVPPIKQVLVNVIMNEKEYCGMVSVRKIQNWLSHCQSCIHYHSLGHSHALTFTIIHTLTSSRCWVLSPRRRKYLRFLSIPSLRLMLHNSSHKLKQSGIKDMN